MKIDEAEGRLNQVFRIVIGEHAQDLGASAALLCPTGYRPVLEFNTSDKTDARKLRKKRSDANIESFDPRIDKILISFVPDLEPDQPAVAPPDFVTLPTTRPVVSDSEIEDFLLALYQAEQDDRQFIGLKYFRDKFLMQHSKQSWVEDDEQRRNVLHHLIEQGCVETGKVPNPQSVDFPVTTIQLNRQHPAVRGILGGRQTPEVSEYRPVKQIGELASRMIVKDRR